MNTPPNSTPGQPSGFGGWLILVVIGQTLAPLRTVAEVIQSRQAYQQLLATPNGATAVYGELALQGAYLVVQLATTIAMYRKSRRFPLLFVYQWVAFIAFVVVDTIFISQVLNLPISQLLSPQDIGRTIGSVIGTGLWIWYLWVSVRVKNTFVN